MLFFQESFAPSLGDRFVDSQGKRRDLLPSICSIGATPLGSLRHCPRAQLCQSHANCRHLSLQDFQALSVHEHQSNKLLLFLGAHKDSPTLHNRCFFCLWRRLRMSSVSTGGAGTPATTFLYSRSSPMLSVLCHRFFLKQC